VFGRLGLLRFTFPVEISDLIHASLRFYCVFVTLYVLGESGQILCLVSPYVLGKVQRLEIT
jgi:hypothetical protein